MWKRGEFCGKNEQVKVVTTADALPAQCLALIGLGEEKKLQVETLRNAGARIQKALSAMGQGAACLDGTGLSALVEKAEGFLVNKAFGAKEMELPAVRLKAALRALIEGTMLAAYSFKAFKTGDGGAPKVVRLAYAWCEGEISRLRELEPEITFAVETVRGAAVARDLQNLPGNFLPPQVLAEAARRLARQTGLRCAVLDEKKMRAAGMDVLLGVAQGSNEPPRFIILEYKPKKAKAAAPVVLIGKGVTFDSGGISLKPGAGMEDMKYDMSGAAAVLGTMAAVSRLKLSIRVLALIPAVENLPSGKAQKPGDVKRALNGKTVEVANTDAEGRLILADALCWAARYKPAAVVDLATLTGAIVTALGHWRAGLFCNDETLAAELLAAGDRSGERLWPLPMDDEYRKAICGFTADLRNVGDGTANSIAGAVFLREFTAYPWAHLDIAGTAYKVERPYYEAKLGTGAGVRLLTDWLRRRADSQAGA
jgi:leucyl aminopeptidase